VTLTESEKQGLRSMSTENRQAADIFRIAEALEAMVPVLRKIETHLEQIRHKA
jgi:hypothetical protein